MILPGLLSCLADNKIQVRQSILKALDCIFISSDCKTHLPLPLINQCIISSDSPTLKRELFSWLSKINWIDQNQKNDSTIDSLLITCINYGLGDKNGDVRKSTIGLLISLNKIVTKDHIIQLCQESQPSMISILQQGILNNSTIADHAAQDNKLIPLKPLKIIELVENSSFSDKNERLELYSSMKIEYGSAWIFEICKILAFDMIELDSLNENHLKSYLSRHNLLPNCSDLIIIGISNILLNNQSSGLNLMVELLNNLDCLNYHLSDWEAEVVIINLINLMERVNTNPYFKQLGRLFPVSKIFSLLCEQLLKKIEKSKEEGNQLMIKDSNSISTILEEIEFLIQRNGSVVIIPSKHLPIFGSLIVSRPGKKLFEIVDHIIRLLGDTAWIYLRLERMKYEEMKTNTMEIISRSVKEEITPTPIPMSKQYISKSFSVTALDHIIDSITTSIDHDCLTNLQKLDSEYMENEYHEIKEKLGLLLPSLLVRLRDCSTSFSDLNDERLETKDKICHFVCIILLKISNNYHMQVNALGNQITEMFFDEIVNCLSGSKINELENREMHIKTLNVILIKSLENFNVNSVYESLLKLLALDFRKKQKQEIQHDISLKHAEYIMKCLWRLTKQIGSHLKDESLKVERLLFDIHSFFNIIPPMEWKSRASQHLPLEDLPLRTVKTILHELVVSVKSDILKYLTLIPNFKENSFVYTYLKTMLEANNIQVDEKLGTDNTSSTLSRNHLSHQEIEDYLRDICTKICSKPNTQTGLIELYEFKKNHDEYAALQIDAFLQKLGGFFYKYITRNLTQIENEVKSSNDGYDIKNDYDLNLADSFKSKLQRMQQLLESKECYSNNEGSTSISVSPIRTRMNSPVNKIEKSSIIRDLDDDTKKLQNNEKSSILNLKERLTRLRQQQQTLSPVNK